LFVCKFYTAGTLTTTVTVANVDELDFGALINECQKLTSLLVGLIIRKEI